MELETLQHNLVALLTAAEESFALTTSRDFIGKHPEAARVLVRYLHQTIAEGGPILKEVSAKLEHDRQSEDSVF